MTVMRHQQGEQNMLKELKFALEDSEKAARKPKPKPEPVNCAGCGGQYHEAAVVYCTAPK